MTYPIPPRFDVGEVVTATKLNQIKTGLEWHLGRPVFRAQQTVAQSIPNFSDTALQFQSIIIDTHSGWTAPDKYTAPVSGWYLVCAGVSWNDAGAGGRGLRLKTNNGSVNSWSSRREANPCSYATSRLIWLAKGDWVQAIANQSSGAARNTYISGLFAPYFWCAFIQGGA